MPSGCCFVGIGFLQSSVPVSLLMMSRSLPFYPATASALSLGTSIVLAGLPLFLVSDKRLIYDAFSVDWLTALLSVVLLIILAIAGRYILRKLFM